METQDVKPRLQELTEALEEMRSYLDVANRRALLGDLEAQAASPDFWNNQNTARQIIDQTNTVRAVLKPYDALVSGLEDVGMICELADMEEDPVQQEAALAEAATALEKVDTIYRDVEMKSLLGEELDAKNAYITVNAGAGGTESCDWADMLARMYHRYADSHEFEFSVLDVQPGDEAGIKSLSALISGPYAFGALKAERGVHRLVRISPFDSASRRHTSFAALDVTAEVDESIEVEILDGDLRVDTFRASGAGGQHVNTTDSAVRITHLPTNIVVQCQAERSQHNNRAKAMLMLKSRLYEWELDQQRKANEKFYGDKGAIAWGSQIRSYVMQPYTMVKDHRTNAEVGNVQGVLDGDLDVFIESYLKKRRQDESV